jgi:hypothetical protein
MTLPAIQSLVDRLAQDTGNVMGLEARDQAIELAVARYSTDRPRTVVKELTGNGTKGLPLPEGWEDGFSRPVSIEHPVGFYPPAFWGPDEFGLFQSPTSTVIRLADAIKPGAAVNVGFTVRHVVDGETDTVPLQDMEAVARWAAAILSESLGAYYAGHQAGTIQAAAVDFGSKNRDWFQQAKDLRQGYYDHLGIDPKRNVAAGAVVAFPQRDSRGRPPIFPKGGRR